MHSNLANILIVSQKRYIFRYSVFCDTWMFGFCSTLQPSQLHNLGVVGGGKLNPTYPMSAKAHSSWFKESNKSPI